MNQNQEPEIGAESHPLFLMVALKPLAGLLGISKDTDVAPAMRGISSALVPELRHVDNYGGNNSNS